MLDIWKGLVAPIAFAILAFITSYIGGPPWFTMLLALAALVFFAAAMVLYFLIRRKYRNELSRQCNGPWELPTVAMVCLYTGEPWEIFKPKLRFFFELVNNFSNYFAEKSLGDNPPDTSFLSSVELARTSKIVASKLPDHRVDKTPSRSELASILDSFGYLPASALDRNARDILSRVESDALNRLLLHAHNISTLAHRIDSYVIVSYGCNAQWEKQNPLAREFWSDTTVLLADSQKPLVGDIPITLPSLDLRNKRNLRDYFRKARYVNLHEYIILVDSGGKTRHLAGLDDVLRPFYEFVWSDSEFEGRGPIFFYRIDSHDSFLA